MSQTVQVRPCPKCGGRPFRWGPSGAPERQCFTCGNVWIPLEAEQLVDRAAEEEAIA